MKKFYKLTSRALLLIATCISLNANAGNGAPHTFICENTFNNVSLSWNAPESSKELKWHDNNDYNGDDGIKFNPQGPCQIYVGSIFTADDLKDYVNETIEAITYFEYNPVLSVTAFVYENESIVAMKEVTDLSDFKKNTTRRIVFDTPYQIKEGVNVRIAVKIVHGSNVNFAAIKNKVPNPKGGQYSYDGNTWDYITDGSFLVTANLRNNVDVAPEGYDVFCDGKKLNDSPITETTYETIQPNGEHKFFVNSVYGTESYRSIEKTLTLKSADSYFTAPSSISVTADKLSCYVAWTAPLLRTSDNELTWSNKTYGNAIGGTASSNTKVWIKNSFEPNDLITFVGSQITAINTSFKEATITGGTLFIMEDDVFVYSETLSAEAVASIKADTWVKFTLATPYTIKSGKSYAYGIYCLQTSKTKPISVDNKPNITGKGDSFSVSSPSSSNFKNSKPTWKTLTSGGIVGNWMMTADIIPAEGSTLSELSHYKISVDDNTIVDNSTENELDYEVNEPGTYEFSVEAIGKDLKTSSKISKSIKIGLPSEYRAPILENSSFDPATKTVKFNWNTDAELRHYNVASYTAGFEEEMALIYGTRFTATELAAYTGYSIKSIKFVIGAALPSLKLEVYKADGTLLASEEIEGSAITPLTFYSLNLKTPVAITGTDDLIIAYSATLPAQITPLVLDAGPAVTNGAVVSLSGGANWMNLGTINSTYKNYNLVISALASKGDGKESNAKSIELSDGQINAVSTLPLIKANEIEREFGVEADISIIAPVAKTVNNDPIAFRVYCNNELAAETPEKTFEETLSSYGVYEYAVSAIYPNSLESPKTQEIVVTNTIPQLAAAPYDLSAVKNDKAITLNWKANTESPELTYQVGSLSYGVGMTGSSTRTSYAVIDYTKEDLAEKLNSVITHISFGLYTTEIKTASVLIIENNNIVFEQDVDVNSLVAIKDGMNTVRLDTPFRITANIQDLKIGYHITYASGIKPLLGDEGPAVDGKGNLLSASASYTSWKSLKSMSSSLDYNWRISATLQAHEKKVKAVQKAENGTTYTIYRDKAIVAKDIAETTFTINNATSGAYNVTAVIDGKETSESNTVMVEMGSSVDGINANAAAYYDAASKCVVFGKTTSAKLFNAGGALIAAAENATSINMAECADDAYIVVFADGSMIKFVK
ncbi:MAG: hypothetical protein PHR45_07805 [Muribaculaceae bacterium]|nr:hypothetical protein [Muribaculaceae bacterium]